MQIYIPSRDRLDAQYTWDNLTPELRAQTHIVCPAEEVAAHLERGRNALARPPLKLSGVRQWLVEEVAQQDQPVIMLDDDLGFFKRKDPAAYNLEPISGTAALNILFEHLHDLVAVEGFAHAGLCPRQGNNRFFPQTLLRATRINAVQCVLPAKLAQHNARYDAVELMEDYHVVLTLLEAGEDNRVIADYAWDQVKGSGAPGGFAHYRTKERQAAAAELLHSLHPHYVRVVEKEPKTGRGDSWGGSRIDVRVYWRRAFDKRPLNPQEEMPKPRAAGYRAPQSYRKDRETRQWLLDELAQLQAETDPANANRVTQEV